MTFCESIKKLFCFNNEKSLKSVNFIHDYYLLIAFCVILQQNANLKWEEFLFLKK